MVQIDNSIHYTPITNRNNWEWEPPHYEKTAPLPEDVKDPKVSILDVLIQNTRAIDQLKECLIAIENKLNGNFKNIEDREIPETRNIITEVNMQYDELATLLSMTDFIYSLL